MALVQYLYVRDNAVNLIDILGLISAHLKINSYNILDSEWYQRGNDIFVEMRVLAKATQGDSAVYSGSSVDYDLHTFEPIDWPARGEMRYRTTTFDFVVENGRKNSYMHSWETSLHKVNIPFEKKGAEYYALEKIQFYGLCRSSNFMWRNADKLLLGERRWELSSGGAIDLI